MTAVSFAPRDEDLDPYLAPRWETSALLVIDTQVDFAEGGSTPVAGTRAVVPALVALVEAYRRAGLPVVHVVRLYDGDDVDLVRRRAIADGARVVRPGSPGSAILPELVPAGAPSLDPDVLLAGRPQVLGPDEVVVWKPRWSAFHRTPLEGLLRERGVDTVVVAGCNFPNCPRATLTDASERDLRAVVVPDAVSGTTEEGLAQVAGLGVVLRSSSAVVAAVAGSVGARDTRGTKRERPGTSPLGAPR